MSPTTTKEVSDTIKTLNSIKSTGPNNNSTKIMKTYKDEISIPLSNHINKSFNIGIFEEEENLYSQTEKSNF